MTRPSAASKSIAGPSRKLLTSTHGGSVGLRTHSPPQTETQYSMGPREGATHPFPIRGKGGLPPPATKTQTRHSPHHVCVGPPMYTCLGGGPVLETETATDWPLPSPANGELKLLSILGRCLSLQTRPAVGGIGPMPKPNGPGGENMAGGKNSKTGPGPIGLAIILLARGFPRVFKRLGLRSSHCVMHSDSLTVATSRPRRRNR